MTLAIIASVALFYAFCVGIGLAFGAAAGVARFGLMVGLSIATGIIVFLIAGAGVAYLWEVAA